MVQEYEVKEVEPEKSNLPDFLKRRWMVEKIRGLTYDKTIRAAIWAVAGGLATLAMVDGTSLFLGFSRTQAADIALGPSVAAVVGIYAWKLTN